MPDRRVRVVVVDDQTSFRRATAAAVSRMAGFVMAGHYECGETAVGRLLNGGADLVLMDINMPGIGGIEAARRIHAAQPGIVIVLMSTYDADELPGDAAHCGASSYLRKERLSPGLLRSLWGAGR